MVSTLAHLAFPAFWTWSPSPVLTHHLLLCLSRPRTSSYFRLSLNSYLFHFLLLLLPLPVNRSTPLLPFPTPSSTLQSSSLASSQVNEPSLVVPWPVTHVSVTALSVNSPPATISSLSRGSKHPWRVITTILHRRVACIFTTPPRATLKSTATCRCRLTIRLPLNTWPP